MTARSVAWFEDDDPRQLGRWLFAAAVVLAIHAGLIGGYLLWRPANQIDVGDDTAAIAIDLTVPDIDREARPQVEELPTPPQQTAPDALLPEKPADTAEPPETRTTQHVEAAAPAVDPSWRTLASKQLQRFKNYPRAARARGEQGVVTLAFSVDRNGHVLSRRIVSGSGHSDLDAEALAVIERAEPLPAFPASMTQTELDVSWSVRFSLH